MIAFTQGLQGARGAYDAMNAFAPIAKNTYSRYSIARVDTPLEQGSFAHIMYEPYSPRHAYDSSSSKATEIKKDRTQSNAKKSNNNFVSTQKKQNNIQDSEKLSFLKKSKNKEEEKSEKETVDFAGGHKTHLHDAHFVNAKRLYEHSALRDEALKEQVEEKKPSSAENNQDRRENTHLTLENGHQSVKEASQCSEDSTAPLKNTDQYSSGAYLVSSSVYSLTENNSENSSLVTQEKYEKSLAVFIAESEKNVENSENAPFVKDISRMIHRRHAQKEDLKIKEEPSAIRIHDEPISDDGERYHGLRTMEKTDSSKNAKVTVRLGIPVSEDAGQKNPVLILPTDMVHQKTSTVHGASAALFEKKGLHYLEKQGNKNLVQDAKFLFRGNSGGDIRLQLNPKELGEVKLMVKLDDNNLVHARAVVSSEEAKDLMQKNLGNLAKQFGGEGYEIGSFSVSVNTEPSDTNDGRQELFDKRAMSKDNSFVEQIEERMHSYVRVSEVVDFVA